MSQLRINRIAAALLVVFWSFPQSAWGWGKEGHQIVGFIAENHLTPQARAAVDELLGQGRRISDEETSNWADYVRNQVRATGPWHYVDIPVESGKYDRKRDCKNSDCVVARVKLFQDILADRSLRPSDRQQALKFLVHFVADMHQPLHCAERRDSMGRPDRGGNECKVRFLDDPVETNLHRVWDTNLLVHSLGEMSLADYANQLNSRITAEQKSAWHKGRARAWANESNKVAIDFVYTGAAADGAPTRLDQAYVRKNQRVVDEQLAKAGVRLAKILNEVFTE
jgi:hypothetical protein